MAISSAVLVRVDGWCALCGGRIRVREDEMSKVCPHCGALLDVMPYTHTATTRHIGEAMSSVRYSLEPLALERAIARLHERYAAREIALRESLRLARVRRLWLWVAALAIVCGFGLLFVGVSIGLPLMLVGVGVLGGALGLRRATGYGTPVDEVDPRFDERQAVRSMRTLRDEITRREAVLSAMNSGEDWF